MVQTATYFIEGQNPSLNTVIGYGSQLTIPDLFNGSSLDSVSHTKKVKSLAFGLGSLKVGDILGVAQTINGKKDFESKDWKMVASQAKMIGADLGLMGRDGNAKAIFTKDGDAYVFASSISVPNQWMLVGLDNTVTRSQRDIASPDSIEAKADFMREISVRASEPITGWNNFLTTKTPFPSIPKFGIMEDNSPTLIPGGYFTGVMVPLYEFAGEPNNQLGLLAIEQINVF